MHDGEPNNLYGTAGTCAVIAVHLPVKHERVDPGQATRAWPVHLDHSREAAVNAAAGESCFGGTLSRVRCGSSPPCIGRMPTSSRESSSAVPVARTGPLSSETRAKGITCLSEAESEGPTSMPVLSS